MKTIKRSRGVRKKVKRISTPKRHTHKKLSVFGTAFLRHAIDRGVIKIIIDNINLKKIILDKDKEIINLKEQLENAKG